MRNAVNMHAHSYLDLLNYNQSLSDSIVCYFRKGVNEFSMNGTKEAVNRNKTASKEMKIFCLERNLCCLETQFPLLQRTLVNCQDIFRRKVSIRSRIAIGACGNLRQCFSRNAHFR